MLMPGSNRIAVNAADLGGQPVNLRWVWEEAGQEKVQEAKIQKTPYSVPIEVGGEEVPRMKSLTLSIAP